ncbi:MAG: GNAT family N-acetyltransferase [Planctomycetota bacterium]
MNAAPQVRQAFAADWPSIAGLLSRAGLPLPSPSDPPVEFVVAARDGAIVACAGWERHGGFALLRSVAVDEAERRRGTGRALVERVLAEIAERGVGEVALVTMSASAFFARLGFTAIPRSETPESLQASPEFSMHCCGNGTWMRATLRAGRPPVPPGPTITLVYRVAPEKREGLLAFLRDAFPFYERHGGTRMALYESLLDPGLFLELVAYASKADYDADAERVERDPETRAKLAEWRTHLAGPVEFRPFGWVEV